MDLQARRVSGSVFSAEDKLEVIFSSDNQPMELVTHTIELVSGINVTHGGGGQPDEYLHYKSLERDSDGDGIIDYSSIQMDLVQESQGESVIKVKCIAITKEDADSYASDMSVYRARKKVAEEANEAFTDEEPVLIKTILSTGDITLSWTQDTLI